MRVATGCNDIESRLVLADGLLVAVLVQLGEQHGNEAGSWFLEAGFGRVGDRNPPTFMNLDEAQAWIGQRLAASTDSPR
jgi:hypothetical protein